MQRWLCLWLVVAVALVSCARGPTPTVAPQILPTETPATKPTPAVQAVQITLWEQEDESGRTSVLYPLIDEFMKENPYIRVVAQSYRTEELRSQFLTAAQEQAVPDVVRGPNDLVGVFGATGALLPLEEMFDPQDLEAFFPGVLAGATLAGTLYGLPDRCGGHLMLVYNKKLLPTPPVTTDALIAMAQAATDAAAGIWGLAYNTREPFWLAPWLMGFGGAVLDPADDRPRLDSPAMVNALQFLYDLSATHQVVPSGCDYEMARSLFATGKAAMVIDGDWSLSGYVQAGIDVGTAPLPQVTQTGLWPAPLVEGRYFMVSRQLAPGSPEFEAVRDFVTFMTSESTQQVWLEKLKKLPSNKAVAQSPMIQQDPLLAGAAAQLQYARGRPASPLLGCFWDSVYGNQQAVLAGTLTPQDAARTMQESAEQCVQYMLQAPPMESKQ